MASKLNLDVAGCDSVVRFHYDISEDIPFSLLPVLIHMTHKRYAQGAVLLTISAIILIAGFNYIVDPYFIYTSLDKSNFSPEVISHSRLTKAWRVLDIQPEAVSFGSSRTETGISPAHPKWHPNLRPKYNLAFSGANIEEIATYFEHAVVGTPIKEAIIGIDFFMFDANKPANIDRGNLRSKNNAPSSLKRYCSLLTVGMLKSSFVTIWERGNRNLPLLLADGMRDPVSLSNVTISTGDEVRNSCLAVEGYFINNVYSGFKLRNSSIDRIAQYRDLLKHAHQLGVDIIIFISPEHARMVEALDCSVGYEVWEDWKRMLVKVNEDVGREVGKPAFRFWDFSGYNQFTTEEVPVKGEKRLRMMWYWGSSHYKKELGDIILDRVFGNQSDRDFGRLVSSENIDRHLKEIRDRRKEWRRTHVQDVKEIGQMKRGLWGKAPKGGM